MSLFMRRIIIISLGFLGGLAAWPLVELLLAAQEYIPSFLVFSLLGGVLTGLVFGLFFGTADGIIQIRFRRILQGGLWGALIGSAGGALGFLLAQSLFLALGEVLTADEAAVRQLGLPLSRALGWALLGMFVGAAEGIRSLSPRKVVIGLLGGLLGGAAGGLILEYLRVLIPGSGLASLSGLLVFGLMLGLAYSLVERSLSFGVLRLLNGRFKGKEFIINQRNLKLGTDHNCDIILDLYRNVEPEHLLVKVRSGEVQISPLNPNAAVMVNDQPVQEHTLKYEDVIKVGSAKLFFKHE